MQLPAPTRLDRPVAQWQPGPHGPGHGPHGGHHWGTGMGGMDAGFGLGMGGGWWLALLLALVVLAVVVAAVYAVTRDDTDDALAVLRERYAAGDLDKEEFERRRERLTGGTG